VNFWSEKDRAPAYFRLADLRPGEVLLVICECNWSTITPAVPPNLPLSQAKFRCLMCDSRAFGIYVFRHDDYWQGKRDNPLITIRHHTPKKRKPESC
jgi:hypothetical protein